jgi:nicotinate-nucleotide adenylyltransferase
VRIGLFGGTFDPPHVGHLLAASDAFEALTLDRLVFVPNAVQPLKTAATGATASDRLEMVRLLCQGDPRFDVDALEITRRGLSFTVDTLREYRTRFPDAALFLLIGADVVPTLPSWREPTEIQRLADVVVMVRGDSLPEAAPVAGRWLRTRRVDVSSTEIRERVKRRSSVRGFVPSEVARYMIEHELYVHGSLPEQAND